MHARRALITCAGRNQRTLPLQTLVDRDGRAKTALVILIEEVLAAGIGEVGVVIAPGDEPAYRSAAGPLARNLVFIEQPAPLGYGHAVWCARTFTEHEPFLLVVGDHLCVSLVDESCATQLVRMASAEKCAVSAVVATHESKLPYYGAIGGRLVGGAEGLFEISTVLEKPTPTVAEQQLVVAGLRAGHYLCFFGMHVLPPTIMDLLGEDVAAAGGAGGVTLSPALARLSRRERYLAAELRGRRYDIGEKYGLLTTQLALALEGRDRDEVLSSLVDLLAASRH
jgi:UTP--glucose-1-phosphate uridylyltransferase